MGLSCVGRTKQTRRGTTPPILFLSIVLPNPLLPSHDNSVSGDEMLLLHGPQATRLDQDVFDIGTTEDLCAE